jgi:hypothetical protein
MRRLLQLGILCLAASLTGCTDPKDTVLGIDATGELHVSAYLDRDGDGQRNPQVDSVIRGLRVSIAAATGGLPVSSVLTDSIGIARFQRVPVGTYVLSADGSVLGDSISVQQIDSARVTLAARDTAAAVITVGYSPATIASIATQPRGKRVSVSGIALNGWSTFGDSTLHLADSTGAIRAVAIRSSPAVSASNIGIGDRIRGQATVGENAGVVALTDFTIVTRATGELPAAIDTTTFAAARAGGRLNAAQVRVTAATVLDAATLAGGDVRYNVDDGSGVLEVVVDASAGISTPFSIGIGTLLDITGVLVPRNDGSGRWRLKPRRSADVALNYAIITIASARTRPAGQLVMIHGIALNAREAFSDASVHVADRTAAIRVTGFSGLFAAGDSIAVLGTSALGAGEQPVLTNAQITVFVRRAIPAPLPITTAAAASANAGQLDAALVTVSNATVDSIAGQPRRLTDGSGLVELQRPTPTFPLPAPGSRVDVTGVLVPVGSGRWVIRPRTASDIVVR